MTKKEKEQLKEQAAIEAAQLIPAFAVKELTNILRKNAKSRY